LHNSEPAGAAGRGRAAVSDTRYLRALRAA
jgi:hypothetical protein